MSGDDDDRSTSPPRRFKAGNLGADGEYVVGRNRPPTASRFAVGDGRPRGRRPKAQRNFDSEFIEEANRKVTLREGGKERKVSKLRATIIRAFDSASSKGHTPAIALVLSQSARLAEKHRSSSSGLSAQEDALLDTWLSQRLAGIAEGDPIDAPPDQLSELGESIRPSTATSGDESGSNG